MTRVMRARCAAVLAVAGLACRGSVEYVVVARDSGGTAMDAGARPADASVDRAAADVGARDAGRADAPASEVQPVADASAGGDAGPDSIAFSGALPTTSGRQTASLTVGGVPRSMLVYVPVSRSASSPLLLLFHGTNGSPDAIFDQGAAQRVADENGVVVVAPNALDQALSDWDHPDSQGVWWTTYPSVDPATNPDLRLVRAVLVAAQRAYGVDPARVYVIGHSNGAFFAQLVADTLGDRIAAWASSSGGLCNCATRPECMFTGQGTTCDALRAQPGWCSCRGDDKPGPVRTAGRRPPAYITHGTADDQVSVYYACTLASRLAASGFETQVVLRDGEQHVMPDEFAHVVWPWLAAHVNR